MIDEFGDAVQHWSERCRKEVDDRSARAKPFFLFWEDVGIRETSPRAQSPRASLAKLLGDLGDGVVNDGIGSGVELSEDQRV